MTPEQQERAGKLLDALIDNYADILEHGEIVIVDGQEFRKKPSAAMCGKIQEFLDRHAIGRMTAADKTPFAETRKRLGLTLTGPMPPIGDDDDAVTERLRHTG